MATEAPHRRNLGETPTTTEGLPQATQSSSTGTTGGGIGGGGNNSLYLYTFLITLLILFGVSCGIVVRSIVLRRRFRRQIQNAIDSGMALPPRVAASRAGRRHQFGERPVMHEVWLNYKGTPLRQQKAGMNEDIETVDKPWQGMKPVSAIVLQPTDKANLADGDQPVLFTREVAAEYFGIDLRSTSEWGRDIVHGLMWPFHPRRSTRIRTAQSHSPTDLAGTTSSPLSAADSQQVEKQMMTVGIMIAMPDPSRRRYNPGRTSPLTASSSSRVEPQARPTPSRKATADGEVELPDIALGVIESDWTGKPAMVRPPTPKKEPSQSRHILRGYGLVRMDRERTDMARRLRRTFDY